MQRLRKTYCISAKQRGGLEGACTFPALDDVDGMKVIRKDDDRSEPSANDLPENISRYLPPRESPEHSHA